MGKATKAKLEDTGERMIPDYHKGQLVYGEHIVRYEAVSPIVKGKTVLDIASGSGYGTALIARSARRVYGVDVDEDAVNFAKDTYQKENIEFVVGSGTSIPLEDNAVDVVVSFETLEHIEDYKTFMKEIKRVLKPDGLLVLSTPNDPEFPEGAHFHIHEFEEDELNKLVAGYFSETKSYYQATWIYNALVSKEQLTEEESILMPTMNLAPVGTNKALYFFLLCANRKITESVASIAAISEHWSTRRMLEHNIEMDAYIKKTIRHYEKILSAKEAQITELRAAATELNLIKKSKSWKFIKKVADTRQDKDLDKRTDT